MRLENVKFGPSTISIFWKTEDFRGIQNISAPSNSPRFCQKSKSDGRILLVKRFQSGKFLQKDKFSPNHEMNLQMI